MIPPLNNINGKFANIDNSHDSGNFSSNETSRQFGYAGITNNDVAASTSRKKGGC